MVHCVDPDQCESAEEIIYCTSYIFTLFARTWVCTVFGILATYSSSSALKHFRFFLAATFWIFTIKGATKSWDFILLSFPFFIFNARAIMFMLISSIPGCDHFVSLDCRVIYHKTSLFAHDQIRFLSLFQSALSFLLFQFISLLLHIVAFVEFGQFLMLQNIATCAWSFQGDMVTR